MIKANLITNIRPIQYEQVLIYPDKQVRTLKNEHIGFVENNIVGHYYFNGI